MFKTIVIVAVIVAGVAYYNDPSSLKPWQRAASEAGKVTAKVVAAAGEGTTTVIKEAPDVASDVTKAVKNF